MNSVVKLDTSPDANPDDPNRFLWNRYPEAWNFLNTTLESMSGSNQGIRRLSEELERKAGTRLLDILDHLVLNDTAGLERDLDEMGFERDNETVPSVYCHPGARLPRIVVTAGSAGEQGAAVSVESIDAFLEINGLDLPIYGSPSSGFRTCKISSSGGTSLWAVEKRFFNLTAPVDTDPGYEELSDTTLHTWRTRPRNFEDDESALVYALSLSREQIRRAGSDLASYLFTFAEREYWQSRNLAARLQKKNLDSVGVGWSNHDHHTYRSSRDNFPALISFFEGLGFIARERFFAGAEAGWGAQVMENPVTGVVLFLDVDLSPEEMQIDFLKEPLPKKDSYGTIGLWCALHGDSFNRSGLHHLAAGSDFDRVTGNLEVLGVQSMQPFSSFHYLKQSFTRGEMWKVDRVRLDRLVEQKVITRGAATEFAGKGVIGSHLEIIERNDGYKGFSQKEVSGIIKQTDPRRRSTP